jgi:hypothetical protein
MVSCNIYRPLHHHRTYREPRRVIIITKPLVPYGGIRYTIPRSRSYYIPRKGRN